MITMQHLGPLRSAFDVQPEHSSAMQERPLQRTWVAEASGLRHAMQPCPPQTRRPSSGARGASPRPSSTACAAAKPKSFSPLQAFGLFKNNNKPKVEKDPVAQVLKEMEFRHPANAKATRVAASAAQKAQLEAERREVRALTAVWSVQHAAARPGYAKCMSRQQRHVP